MLSTTLRCGSRPKCWKTIETLRRRVSSSALSAMAVMSSPYSFTVPAVGSMSRVSRRTSVDLPEPERPITTKTSPGATSKPTSRMPTTWPVFSCSSLRESWASGLFMIASAFGPKIFQRPSTCTAASSALEVGRGGGLGRGRHDGSSGLRLSPGG